MIESLSNSIMEDSILSKSKDGKSKNPSIMLSTSQSNNQSILQSNKAGSTISNKLLEIFKPKGSAHGSQQSIPEVPDSEGIRTETTSRNGLDHEPKDESIPILEEWLSDGEICIGFYLPSLTFVS
jgi:hypothetical protein